MQINSARHKSWKSLIIKEKQFIHSRYYLPVTFQTVGLGRLVYRPDKVSRANNSCCYFTNSMQVEAGLSVTVLTRWSCKRKLKIKNEKRKGDQRYEQTKTNRHEGHGICK
mgnify:CR=1 FL=1